MMKKLNQWMKLFACHANALNEEKKKHNFIMKCIGKRKKRKERRKKEIKLN